jgi:hypothetical protein
LGEIVMEVCGCVKRVLNRSKTFVHCMGVEHGGVDRVFVQTRQAG